MKFETEVKVLDVRLAQKSGKYRYEPIVGRKKTYSSTKLRSCVGRGLKKVKDDRILLFIGLVAVVSFLPKKLFALESLV